MCALFHSPAPLHNKFHSFRQKLLQFENIFATRNRCDAHPIQYQGQRSTHGEPDSHDNTCTSKWQIYFLHGRIVSGDTNLPWMTLLFQRQTLELRTYAQKHKLKTSDRHFAFPERVSTSSCNKRQQPHICKPPPAPRIPSSPCVYREKNAPRLPARLYRRAHMSRRFFCSVLVDTSVPVVTVMCTPAPCYYHGGGLCAPVRYIRAVRESEWAQLVLAERAECALGNVEHLCTEARTSSSPH